MSSIFFRFSAVFCCTEPLTQQPPGASYPLLPPRLFRSSIFTLTNIAVFAFAMLMFGAIIYIPVYAQGVLGVNATSSGLILMPLMITFVVLGIVTGQVVTRTGRYKSFAVVGVTLSLVLEEVLGRQSEPGNEGGKTVSVGLQTVAEPGKQ